MNTYYVFSDEEKLTPTTHITFLRYSKQAFLEWLYSNGTRFGIQRYSAPVTPVRKPPRQFQLTQPVYIEIEANVRVGDSFFFFEKKDRFVFYNTSQRL